VDGEYRWMESIGGWRVWVDGEYVVLQDVTVHSVAWYLVR
jgi:hypothetical protein